MRRLLPYFFTAVKNNAAGLLAFLVIWLLVALFFPPYILPSPVAVLQEIPSYLNRDIGHHLAVTVYRVLAGFGLALVLGTAFGILAFVTRLTARVNIFMVSLQVIPGTILGIVLLLAMGIGDGVPIALVAILTLPTIAINIAHALAKKKVALEQYLISAGGGKKHLVQYLYLPALIPTFQSNLSIGFGLSVKVILLGEFIGSQDGIGYLLNVARIYLNMKEVIFYLVLVLLFTALFETTQSFLFAVCLEKYFYPG
jgi:NitT/TauT family transport system permease protein